MSTDRPEPWAHAFPELFAPTYVDYADVDVTMTTHGFSDDLVNRLHAVGVTDDGSVVVCGSDLGWRFLPGGRRETGERLRDLIDRELQEEAGAARTGPWRIFASQVAHSRRSEPHLPHWAHPVGHWAYAVTPVRVVGPPTCPDDDEQVTEVLSLPPGEAARYLAHHDAVHADVVRLADAMGLVEAFREHG